MLKNDEDIKLYKEYAYDDFERNIIILSQLL